MTEYDLIESIKREVLEIIDSCTVVMSQGGCNSYEEYMKVVGRISSAEQILSFVEEQEKKFLEQ